MLHAEREEIRELLLEGKFGLELEMHRVTGEGRLSHTPHPFPGDARISRDFSEDQVEINTLPEDSPEAALAQLQEHLDRTREGLKNLPEPECLWMYSNPPLIENEEDIRIAQFEERANTEYREFLSDRYGRYLMTYSGIHFNYSFSDQLLRRNFEADAEAQEEEMDFPAYRDRFYLKLAEKASFYSWLPVALLAASPVADSSFYETDRPGQTVFTGFASPRCSEIGYWNHFAPVFDYSGMDAYADSIQEYVDEDYLIAARELYYPVRVKPPGKYTLEALREKGVSHIELRMVDIDPFEPAGISVVDVRFLQLFLIWLSMTPMAPMSAGDQVQAVKNCKNAARYDLNTVKITWPSGKVQTVEQAVRETLQDMKERFRDAPPEYREALEHQIRKMTVPGQRTAVRVRNEYGERYLEKMLDRSRRA